MEWVKIYTDGWLRGSIRAQLTPAERSVWVDLISLAGENRKPERRGIIEVAKGIPYTREKIASMLDVPVELLNSTIEKCVRDENSDNPTTRIVIDDDGTIRIGNWDYYQNVPKRVTDKRDKANSARSEKARQAKEKDAILAATMREVNENTKSNRALKKAVDELKAKGNGNHELLSTEAAA